MLVHKKLALVTAECVEAGDTPLASSVVQELEPASRRPVLMEVPGACCGL